MFFWLLFTFVKVVGVLGYILFVLLIRTSKCVPGCPDEEPNSPLLPAVAGVLRLPSYLFYLTGFCRSTSGESDALLFGYVSFSTILDNCRS